MSIPLYTASPINSNAPMSAFPTSPSNFAMRYTPASALEEQLAQNASLVASAIPLPPSQPSTPSPGARQNQKSNTLSHASNAFPPSPTPLKVQPSQANTNTTASSTPSSTPVRTPSLTRLSIPITPPPKTIPHPYTAGTYSPVSQPSSTYSPPHLPNHHHYSHHNHQHTRNNSSISALSPFDATSSSPYQTHHHYHSSYNSYNSNSTANFPLTPGNNPPGYVQNTRDSFEDRPVADVEEQTFTLPRGYYNGATSASPFYTDNSQPKAGLVGHRHRKSYAGPGILNGEIFFQPLDGSLSGTGGYGGSSGGGGDYYDDDGDDKGVWEMAGKWARTAYRKLGEAEEGVWRVVSGER